VPASRLSLLPVASASGMEFASFRHRMTTEQSAPMNRVLPGRLAPWSSTTLEPVVTVMPDKAPAARVAR
jgi:hypothetical protein